METDDAAQIADDIIADDPDVETLYERAESEGLPVDYSDEALDRHGHAEDDSVLFLDCEDGDVVVDGGSRANPQPYQIDIHRPADLLREAADQYESADPLRLARELLGWSRREMSEQLGLSVTDDGQSPTLRDWERGRRTPGDGGRSRFRSLAWLLEGGHENDKIEFEWTGHNEATAWIKSSDRARSSGRVRLLERPSGAIEEQIILPEDTESVYDSWVVDIDPGSDLMRHLREIVGSLLEMGGEVGGAELELLRQTEILPVCEECRAVGSSEVDVDWVEDPGFYPEEQDRHVYLCEYCQSTVD